MAFRRVWKVSGAALSGIPTLVGISCGCFGAALFRFRALYGGAPPAPYAVQRIVPIGAWTMRTTLTSGWDEGQYGHRVRGGGGTKHRNLSGGAVWHAATGRRVQPAPSYQRCRVTPSWSVRRRDAECGVMRGAHRAGSGTTLSAGVVLGLRAGIPGHGAGVVVLPRPTSHGVYSCWCVLLVYCVLWC